MAEITETYNESESGPSRRMTNDIAAQTLQEIEIVDQELAETEPGPSKRRSNETEAQTLQEACILDQELTGAGTRQNLPINCSLYSPKIIVRFHGLSPLNNSLKRVLVVAPKQPQCRF